ncbi:MAG TPA: polyketide synthase, partial [Candidatus Binatia bacterium]|nr:polyketide synthase [Candidatus Binatia bacterium]
MSVRSYVAQPPIAIVGMGCRLPGAADAGEFWRRLLAGEETIRRLAEDELEDGSSEALRRTPSYVKARPVLDRVEDFDAEFFGMYAREAELTDPQQRVFLECAWEALEDAGCDPQRFAGAIGVFGGCSMNTYFLKHVMADRGLVDEFTGTYQVGCYPMLVGALNDFLATRVAYKLDLKGPAVTVQS